MTITVAVTYPKNLLSRIKEAIDDGEVVTWNYDSAGDFFHAVEQWKGSGWLRPSVGDQELQLHVVPVKGVPMVPAVAAILQGRFVEMLLAHFGQHFARACVEP